MVYEAVCRILYALSSVLWLLSGNVLEVDRVHADFKKVIWVNLTWKHSLKLEFVWWLNSNRDWFLWFVNGEASTENSRKKRTQKENLIWYERTLDKFNLRSIPKFSMDKNLIQASRFQWHIKALFSKSERNFIRTWCFRILIAQSKFSSWSSVCNMTTCH